MNAAGPSPAVAGMARPIIREAQDRGAARTGQEITLAESIGIPPRAPPPARPVGGDAAPSGRRRILSLPSRGGLGWNNKGREWASRPIGGGPRPASRIPPLP